MPSFGELLLLGGLLSLSTTARATYTIQDTYNQTNFFQGFEFFSGQDPTNGFVQYHTAVEANSTSLAGYANNAVYLGIDSSTMSPTTGRGSVRVNSKKTYTKGLIIADIAHQPSTQCGTWPALWTVGDDWPNNGEIDIIEGVNMATNTSYTLHTSEGCSFSQGNCNEGFGGTGCGIPSGDTKTFGDDFNAIGGGVFAVEWTSQAINIFFFPRTSQLPADIASGSPQPSTWGTPATTFSGSGCDIDKYFNNHQIVFDTTFCGDWAGKVWESDPVCSAKAATCEEYVSNHPEVFKESYWLINSVKVFTEGDAAKRSTRQFKA